MLLHVPMKIFFRVTGCLLLVVVIGLFGVASGWIGAT
jgi:high-affinity Fe2+/Pb2+ permease